MPQFKYANLHAALQGDCPPASTGELERRAYRYVFNPMTAEGSFTPQAVLDPRRFNKKPCCSLCGLSMFETESQARKEFGRLKENTPLIAKKIGDRLAEIRLDTSHGLQTDSDPTGHFDLHEYDGADILAAAVLLPDAL